MTFELTVRLNGVTRRDDESNVYVSYCPALDLYSQAPTEDQAKEALESAIRLFLMSCVERQQLCHVLHARGFTKAAGVPLSRPMDTPEFILVREHRFESTFDVNVPLYLLAAEQEGAAACRH